MSEQPTVHLSPNLEKVLSHLTETEQRRTRRKTRRKLYITLATGFGLGVGTYWSAETFWPADQPRSFASAKEDLTAKQRYQRTVEKWLTERQNHWDPNIFRIRHIEEDGSVIIEAGLGSMKELTFFADKNGELLYLREQPDDYSPPVLIYDARHKEIRLHEKWSGGRDKTTRHEQTWITPEDELFALRTDNGSERNFTVNGSDVDPQLNIEKLKKQLSTPQRVALFQWTYGNPVSHMNLLDYLLSENILKNYRLSLQELQKRDYEGNCNDFAEMAAELLSPHGWDMYIISMRPDEWPLLLGHQVAGFRLEDGSWGVIDEGKLFYAQTLKEVGAHYNMEVFEEGGVVRWEKANNASAKLAQHLMAKKTNTFVNQ